MQEGLIRITPDKSKARSIMDMASTTLEMLRTIDLERFSSNALLQYYDVIRELISILLLLDGYKTFGENAHKNQIEYLRQNYKEFKEYEVYLINELRITRNKIAYDGFFIEREFLGLRLGSMNSIINKLIDINNKRLY